MELKKSNKADLEQMVKTNFLIGFIVALTSVFVIFEWTSFVVKTEDKEPELVYLPPEDEEIVPISYQAISTVTPPPASINPIAEVIQIVENNTLEGDKNNKSKDKQQDLSISVNSEGPGKDILDVIDEVKLPELIEEEELTPVIPIPVEPPALPELSTLESTDEEEIYEFVEEMPKFPGGINALVNYLQTNIRYPNSLKNNDVEGSVTCKFVITKTGEVDNVSIIKSFDDECDNEVLRIVKAMPKWEPGKQDKKPVNCYITLPVKFMPYN